MINLSDYDDAIEFICEEIIKFPKDLQPQSFYRAGNVGSPGISDLDIIFGFKDDFCYGKQFIDLFNDIKNQINNNEIFFLHLPHVFSYSLFKELPYFSFNSANDLELIYGKSVFNKNAEISKDQALIRSMEFIHARIIDLLIQSYTKKIDQKNILVVGHSLIHSLNAINYINPKLKLASHNFKTFCKIENYRKKITQGVKIIIDQEECQKLYMGICSEFFYLLSHYYDEIEKKVAFHWSKNFDYYKYHHNIILRNLKRRSKNLHINMHDSLYEIRGFSWEMLCLSDNFFLKDKDFSTVFIDQNFKEEILKKRNFLRKLFEFNMINFGNSFGRSSFRTYSLGPVQDYLSMNM
jgi:hypothetical protein